jgi:hypothetical protein
VMPSDFTVSSNVSMLSVVVANAISCVVLSIPDSTR